MNNSFKFFMNTSCEYFPCHELKDDFNCLFCYCPMYRLDRCLGTPAMLKLSDNSIIKDCSNCTFPHIPENYDKIIKFLSKDF